MTPAPGFAVDLVAAEPHVRQPVCIEFDDRGRLWAIQYLQYPNPAGLKRVQVDRYSAHVYDRVPEPPPRGPRGATGSRSAGYRRRWPRRPVTRLRQRAEPLHGAAPSATAASIVLQVALLLFYPIANRDDVPDGDPEVLLSGFGMEDAQSLANTSPGGRTAGSTASQGSTANNQVRGTRIPAGRLALSSLLARVRAVLRGGRQLLRPRLRRQRQALLQHQLRRPT